VIVALESYRESNQNISPEVEKATEKSLAVAKLRKAYAAAALAAIPFGGAVAIAAIGIRNALRR